MHRLARVAAAALTVLAGCSDSLSGPPDPPAVPRPDPALGRIAFEQECAKCHASKDGFDLAMFGFTDTTIIRRAVKHVDSATAKNIVAYIRTVSAPHEPEKLRLFQPKGAPLATDWNSPRPCSGATPGPPS